MKHLFITLILCITFSSYAQIETKTETEYEALLKKDVQLLDKATNKETYTSALYKFERLRKVASDKWLPQYYAAYCKIVMVRWEDSEGEMLNDAISYLEKALKIQKNSEILTLLGRAYLVKIQMKITNGPKYTMKVKELLKQALELDSENPRTYLIFGQYYYYIPRFVGGNKDTAEELFKKAKVLYDAEYEKNKKEYSTLPHWGKELNEWYLSHL